MKTKTKTRIGRIKALSPAKQAALRDFWNNRLQGPFVCVPSEQAAKGLITPTEARKSQVHFGEFAAGYFKRVLARINKTQDIARRRKGNKKVVGVGFGLGYDAGWFPKASAVNLQTWWVDVSSAACIWASTRLQKKFQAMERRRTKHTPAFNLEPVVKVTDIQSFLAEPEKFGLSLASVEVWYLSRLLNCLPTPSAKIILQEIGRTALGQRYNPSKRNAVVIINALCDQNRIDARDGISIRRSKKMILSNLSRGAGRSVEARFVEYYDYFGKVVTAMTIMAK